MSSLDNSLFVVQEPGIQEGQVSPAEMRSALGTPDVARDGIVQEEVQTSFLHPWLRACLHRCRVGLSGNSFCWIENGIKLLEVKQN